MNNVNETPSQNLNLLTNAYKQFLWSCLTDQEKQAVYTLHSLSQQKTSEVDALSQNVFSNLSISSQEQNLQKKKIAYINLVCKPKVSLFAP